MDVDEYLVADRPVALNLLASVPHRSARHRVRPMEAAVGRPVWVFQGFHSSGPDRARISGPEALPEPMGPYLKGGFLSHLAG